MEINFHGAILSDELFEEGAYRLSPSDPAENEKWIRILKYGETVYPGDGTDLITFGDRELMALLNGNVLAFYVGEYQLLLRLGESSFKR